MTCSPGIGLFLVISLAATAAHSAETAAFLKLAPGPRPIGLGEAFTAVADDLNAQSLNPAGLTQLRLRELSLSHADLFSGAKLDAFNYAHPLTRHGAAVAAGFFRLSHGRIAGRDALGRPSGDFQASDTAVQLACALAVPGMGRLGVNVKYLNSTLAYASARGMALDLGMLRRSRGPWSFGASVRNLGPGLRYADRTEPLPLTIAAGGAVRLSGALLVSAEVRHRPRTGAVAAGIGSEYSLLPSLVLRGGYRSGIAENGPASGPVAVGGLGIGFGVRLRKAQLDYAFTPQGELGQAQRIALSTRF